MQIFINNNGRLFKLLEECKYEQEKIKMEDFIDDDVKKSLSDGSDSESDNDESNE